MTENRAYSALKGRYIITYVDKNGDNVVNYNPTTKESDEIQPFQMPTLASPTTTSNFYSYLTLFENSFSSTSYNTSELQELAQRQVNFVRGIDQTNSLSTNKIDAVRKRSVNNGPTWPLGDVVSSSPLIIGAPAANYHILYGDKTYQTFFEKYKYRRQVAYVGANDGMLHAFNAGFYSRADKGFISQLNGEVAYELGMELWAYVPFNLLPHLRWLMNPNYGGELHVAYMDLPPRAYDVRIFTADEDHPNGWGTILVAGMRLGGGEIQVDIDKDQQRDSTDPKMSSAYVILDITNPEKKPRPLAEIRMPNLGFTTCIPSIMPMTTANTSDVFNNDNQWYLVFGSGPASNIGAADPTMFQTDEIKSEQSGHLYVLDLKYIVESGGIKSYDGFSMQIGKHIAATTGSDAFISDPAAVDMDFNSKNATKEFKTDVVYFGTVKGSSKSPSGSLHRLLTNNQLISGWNAESLLINVQQPISVSPTVVMDKDKTLWVYFGAGRFYDDGDIPQEGDTEQYLSFFGVKEPAWNSTHFDSNTPGYVALNNLFNSTEIMLTDYGECNGTYQKSCVEVVNATTNSTIFGPGEWDSFVEMVDQHSGWRYDFNQPWEKVLGQAAVLGGTVLFTAYTPEAIVCNVEGNSRLYGVYYKTGTAYFDPIFKGSSDVFSTFAGLGQGMAISPTLHISEDGTKAFVQTSSGAIIPIDLNIDVQPKTLFWRKNTQ